MPLSLVVSESFLTYEPGDVITEPSIVAAIRASENAARVIQVSDEVVPPPPPPGSQTSPLQALVNELALLKQRVAILEARPVGGGTDPPPSGDQLAGARVVDLDGTAVHDGDGNTLVR